MPLGLAFPLRAMFQPILLLVAGISQQHALPGFDAFLCSLR